MTLLSDRMIIQLVRQGKLGIEPFNLANVQPNSYDVHLHRDFLWFGQDEPDRPLDPDEDCAWAFQNAALLDDKPTLLMPDTCILGRTVEIFTFPKNVAGRVEGVSTLGRIFLTIHITAGFFDAGFPGSATLEIKNLGPRPIVLRSGMRIGQMAFQFLDQDAFNPYGSRNRYYGQVDPTPSRRLSTPSDSGESGLAAVESVYSRYDSSGVGSTRPEETVVQPLHADSEQGSGIGESQESS